MQDDTKPYFEPRHVASAIEARREAEAASREKLIAMLRMYADDIENDFGRAHAPAWMREAANRLQVAINIGQVI